MEIWVERERVKVLVTKTCRRDYNGQEGLEKEKKPWKGNQAALLPTSLGETSYPRTTSETGYVHEPE